jgi:hypothetical protein
VYGNGPITLVAGGQPMVFGGWKRHDEGSLFATRTGLAGKRGTLLALMPGSKGPDFETCRNWKTWTTEVTWDQMKPGSMLCLKVLDGRRGAIRIDQMPNFEAPEPSVALTGHVWDPIVGK